MAQGKTTVKPLSVAKQQKMAVEEAERLIQAAKKSGEDLTVEEIDESLISLIPLIYSIWRGFQEMEEIKEITGI